MDNIEKQIEDIYAKLKEGKLLYIGLEGVYERPLDTIKIMKPDSFLYDINRLPEVIMTNAKANPKSQRWVNDLALIFAFKQISSDYEILLEAYQKLNSKYHNLIKSGNLISKNQNNTESPFITGQNIGV